jgi:hypothetical protein
MNPRRILAFPLFPLLACGTAACGSLFGADFDRPAKHAEAADGGDAEPSQPGADGGVDASVQVDADDTCSTGATCSTAPDTALPVGVAGAWTLVFDDEFNGTVLDTTKWLPYWGTEGNQLNNVGTYASNVAVSGGSLILTLADGDSGAAVTTATGSNGFAVRVGMYTEARVRFPGNGTKLFNWPSWRMSGLQSVATGEHDIAEVMGGALSINYQSSSSGPHDPGVVSGYWGDAFHVYGVHRKASSADVYWDGNLIRSYATDDNGGGENLTFNVGSGEGVPAAGAASQVTVDYVRVWK